MKRIIIVFALILVAAIGSAQIKMNEAMISSNSVYSDTLTDAETAYYTTRTISSYDQILSIGILCTNISGTSAGSVLLQSTIDGTNWVNVNQTNTTTLLVSTNDTLTITDAAYNIWTLVTLPNHKYRLAVGQTGTSTTSYPVTIFVKDK